MQRCAVPFGGHGSPDDGAPSLAVETEAAVKAIAQPLRIVERLCCDRKYVAVVWITEL